MMSSSTYSFDDYETIKWFSFHIMKPFIRLSVTMDTLCLSFARKLCMFVALTLFLNCIATTTTTTLSFDNNIDDIQFEKKECEHNNNINDTLCYVLYGLFAYWFTFEICEQENLRFQSTITALRNHIVLRSSESYERYCSDSDNNDSDNNENDNDNDSDNNENENVSNSEDDNDSDSSTSSSSSSNNSSDDDDYGDINMSMFIEMLKQGLLSYTYFCSLSFIRFVLLYMTLSMLTSSNNINDENDYNDYYCCQRQASIIKNNFLHLDWNIIGSVMANAVQFLYYIESYQFFGKVWYKCFPVHIIGAKHYDIIFGRYYYFYNKFSYIHQDVHQKRNSFLHILRLNEERE